MMNNPKYIVHDGAGYIFLAFDDHAGFARRNNFNKEDIQGAGFVAFSADGPQCYGKSISLGIPSHDNDTRAIRRLCGYHD